MNVKNLQEQDRRDYFIQQREGYIHSLKLIAMLMNDVRIASKQIDYNIKQMSDEFDKINNQMTQVRKEDEWMLK